MNHTGCLFLWFMSSMSVDRRYLVKIISIIIIIGANRRGVYGGFTPLPKKSVKHDFVRFAFLGTRFRTIFVKQWIVKMTPKRTRLRTIFCAMLPFIIINYKKLMKIRQFKI